MCSFSRAANQIALAVQAVSQLVAELDAKFASSGSRSGFIRIYRRCLHQSLPSCLRQTALPLEDGGSVSRKDTELLARHVSVRSPGCGPYIHRSFA
ncbi:hypothetical protein LJR294_001029 [Variovorax paradoxus]